MRMIKTIMRKIILPLLSFKSENSLKMKNLNLTVNIVTVFYPCTKGTRLGTYPYFLTTRDYIVWISSDLVHSYVHKLCLCNLVYAQISMGLNNWSDFGSWFAPRNLYKYRTWRTRTAGLAVEQSKYCPFSTIYLPKLYKYF